MKTKIKHFLIDLEEYKNTFRYDSDMYNKVRSAEFDLRNFLKEVEDYDEEEAY